MRTSNRVVLALFASSLFACNALVGVSDVDDVGDLGAAGSGTASAGKAGTSGTAQGGGGAAGKGTAGVGGATAGKAGAPGGSSGAGAGGAAGAGQGGAGQGGAVGGAAGAAGAGKGGAGGAGKAGASGGAGKAGAGAAGATGGTAGSAGAAGDSVGGAGGDAGAAGTAGAGGDPAGGAAGAAGDPAGGAAGSAGDPAGGAAGAAGDPAGGAAGAAGDPAGGAAGAAGDPTGGAGGSAGTGGNGTTTYALSGTLSAGGGTVVLINNSTGEERTLNVDGPFAFTTPVSTYDVTVKTHPAGRFCYVQRGEGTATTDVTNVKVGCSTAVGLLGVYPLDKGTGTDLSGNGNTMTAIGAPGSTTNRFGDALRAYSSASGGGWVINSQDRGALSASAWIRRVGPGAFTVLSRDKVNGDQSAQIRVEAGSQIVHYEYWDGGPLEQWAVTPLATEWAHVTIVAASGGVRAATYVNGKPDHGYFATCCNYQSQERWEIHAGGATHETDDVRFYDRMLSAGEIAEIYNAESETPIVNACAGQSRAINDNFTNSLDTTSWVIEQSGASSATFFAHEEEGSLKLRDRGLLRTKDELVPSAAKPVRVVGSFVANAPGTRDFPGIMTRAKQKPNAAFNDTPDSHMWCTAEVRPGGPMSVQIVERVNATVLGSANTPFTVNQGDRFTLAVTDDGTTVVCRARNLNTGETKTVSLASVGAHTENYVYFVNREFSTFEGDHETILDAASVEHGLPTPSWHWTFDEPGPTSLGYASTEAAPATFATTKRLPGRFGHCAALDTVGGASAGTGASALGTKDFTVAYWLFQGPTSAGNRSILGTRNGGAVPWWSVRTTNGADMRFEVAENIPLTEFVSLSVPGGYDGGWHHWAMRRTGPTVAIFRDGSLLASKTHTSTLNLNASAPGPLRIGADDFVAGTTDCIDDLRIYEVSLADCDIAALATAP